MDDALRNGLWNAVTLHYWSLGNKEAKWLPGDKSLYALSQLLWHDYFKWPIDTLPTYWYDAHDHVRGYFFDCNWNEVYDFLEFLARNKIAPYERISFAFMNFCNTILEREMSAYRFVNGRIVEISSEEEIAEIEEAQQPAGRLKPVTRHLNNALALLADRDAPDYSNSIKEAISAVEAMCNLIAGSSSATLGNALRELDRKKTVTMHPALKDAFNKLYGYTSSADGIRHALLEESDLDFEDAKFMLVSCSAFINYLKIKATKAGINL